MSALLAEGLGKSFRHRTAGEPRTFRRWVEGGWLKRSDRGTIRALDNLSLEVEPGEMLGVIGHNGSGKSTLLRLLGGVMQPDQGRVIAAAPVNGLLELNTGMHPDLTGRENILINGVLSGLLKDEVRQRLDRIIDFAELEDHIDNPVRTYSSGMKLRLGFSVAVHVEPEILLIDEVLAVGDAGFQRKCLRRIEEFKAQGCAIVLISHDLGQVQRICDRVLWLERGRMRELGNPEMVVASYEAATANETERRTLAGTADRITAQGLTLRAKENRFGTLEAEITDVSLRNSAGGIVESIIPGSALTIQVKIRAPALLAQSHLSVSIADTAGRPCFDANTETDGVEPLSLDGELEVSIDIDRLDLTPGSYTVSVGIWHADWDFAYDYHLNAYPLEIIGGVHLKGVLSPPRSWRINPKGR